MKKRIMALALAGMMAISALIAGPVVDAKAAELPKKIEVQLPAKAGGGTDVVGRALTNYMNNNSNTNFTVVNNTDGSGVVAMETVRNSKADGSTILFFHTTMCIKTATGVYNHVGDEEFKVIGAATPTNKGGYILVVPTESGITDVEGFIAAAKEANGEYMIGVETGGSSHIMAGIMAKALDAPLKYVEAGSDTDKLTALVGGSINAALVNANQAKQYIEAEKVNAIACFSATDEGGRNDILPDVPSFPELGYDCVFGTYMYVLGSPNMSDETAKAIYDLFDAATKDPETLEVLTGTGMACEFAPFEEAQEIMHNQQTTLTAVCEELGLSK